MELNKLNANALILTRNYIETLSVRRVIQQDSEQGLTTTKGQEE